MLRYLKAIFLVTTGSTYTKLTSIAFALGVSVSAVSIGVKKLQDSDLVEFDKKRDVKLTIKD